MPATKHPGRPRTQMSDEVIGKILSLVRRGVAFSEAAVRAGVPGGVARKHRRRNPGFASDVATAEADFEATLVRNVRDGAKDWRPADWLLERGWPRQWCRPEHRIANLAPDDAQAIAAGIVAIVTMQVERAAGARADDEGAE